MGHSSLDPVFHELRPWTGGRVMGAKRALKPQQAWASLLGHAKIESTVRYLGVDVEDAPKLSERESSCRSSTWIRSAGHVVAPAMVKVPRLMAARERDDALP